MTAPEPTDVPPAARSTVLCSPWASPADVPEVHRSLLADDEWVAVLTQASEILFYLSGRRFYGGGCTESVVLRSHPAAAGTGAWPYHRTWGECPCWGYGQWLDNWLYPPRPGLYSGSHYAAFAIQLPREDVTVTSVTHNGLPFTDFMVNRNGWLERTDGGSWDLCGDSTTVNYSFGVAPPESGVQAVLDFALQIALGRVGDDSCKLPDRVQSITRQGISVTLLDPQEFLKDGRTGIYSVDLFLSAVNPYARPQRARVWSPDIPATTRTT